MYIYSGTIVPPEHEILFRGIVRGIPTQISYGVQLHVDCWIVGSSDPSINDVY